MIKPSALILAIMMLASCQNAEELKSEQYFVEGYQLYTTHCANCHQPDGKGMSNLYPPLAGSPALTNKALISCVIKNGMRDTIQVNGKVFSRPMPANPKLTEIEIAEIVSFVSMKWGKDSTYTKIETVQAALQGCKTY
ncbi:c-type cytochrome [Dyadobacter pollutisoli]|uniref:Cytochrome c n=1 Tax=Dyadobacter pollutisoli TaxID=2910158 RepID=A0A9E8N9I8_9BACT|nr:cytochrome c [Dyadobacter pollutisoli]WAC12380.1 cytochrome c [Dyadobacter pollutisoli]